MNKVNKDLVVGLIKSTMHKTGKRIEKGKLVTAEQFEQMLKERNKHEHLYFWVESFSITSGRGVIGNPYVEIIVTSTEGTHFRCTFMVMKPHGTFTNQTPFAQTFSIEEMED